jgi:dolichyl-phosphate beta-glucosyltransferase
MKDVFLSVIIPAHNEGRRIGQTLESIAAYLNKQDYLFEVIVCEDGSTDDTVSVVESKKNIIKDLEISSRKENGCALGKGDAVRRGMLKAKGKYRIFVDADNATPFWQVEKLLKLMEGDKINVVIGSRYVRGARLVPPRGIFRSLVSRGGNIIINFFLRLPYKDTRCGFKLFTRKAGQKIFSKVLLASFGFDDEVLVLAKKFGFEVKEAPVEWHEKAESKVSFRDVLKSFSEMWQIKRNLRRGKYDDNSKIKIQKSK